jgi:hypothetical protein
MRTPPPASPQTSDTPKEYEPTWLDRTGADGGVQLRAMGYGALVFAITFLALLFAAAAGGIRLGGILGALAVAALLGGLVGFVGRRLSDTAGAVAKAFTLPSGLSTPYEQQFSRQESLAARGDVAAALEAYEAIIAEQPGAVAPRIRAGEHYAAKNRDAKRAAALFREVRDTPGVSARDALYASSRLVDLYDGPLAEPGRALVELRRIIELYPGTELARHAKTALPRLKAQQQAAREQGGLDEG